ncbi:MAG: ABC transporter ATP-binding protein [Lachnospiraceae bacterium]|nr:ABC transporter ATP-binding protein [Lachnospiraceae bacterium]
MNQETVISVKDVHIRYKVVKVEGIKKSFFSLKKTKLEEIEAVKGVSFDVYKGEIIGLVGKNGSGKSTLLRSVAGIFSADEGTIDIGDYSISLLSIGVGFKGELTGKENIYLSGLLLGFSKEEINAKYKEIVNFSGLGKFINMPVKTYSSGMHSKLAFSITAVMETDIILIDEVLSVGDIQFKKKSFRKMQDLISARDRTVIIVSHSNETIRNLCTRVIWLNDGEIEMDGETEEVLAAYEAYMEELNPALLKKSKKAKEEEKIMRLVREEDESKKAEEAAQDAAESEKPTEGAAERKTETENVSKDTDAAGSPDKKPVKETEPAEETKSDSTTGDGNA